MTTHQQTLTNNTIRIPIQLLRSAFLCASKQDIINSIVGVAITQSYIVATDAKVLFACSIAEYNPSNEVLGDIEVIIPHGIVKVFLSTLDSKFSGIVNIELGNKSVHGGYYDCYIYATATQLDYQWAKFNSVCGVFPDFKRLIPEIDFISHVNECLPKYDVNHLVKMQKVSKHLGDKDGDFDIYTTDVYSASVIKFNRGDFKSAIALVMPKRV